MISFDGENILSAEIDVNRLRQKMGMVFQLFNLYPHMTALGNVTLALRKVLERSKREAEDAGRAVLDHVEKLYSGQGRGST